MQTSKQQRDKKRERERERGFVMEKSLDKKKIIYFLQFLTDIAFNPWPGSCCNTQRCGNDESG